MRRSFSPRLLVRHRKGAALVIILAFVVLLAVLVLAFFSRAILARQVSNASANQTKVDLLARGAIDVIVSDLRQEIEVGSTNQTVNGFKSYYPLHPTNMLPARSGNPSFTAATNDPIPNLVRRSVRNDPLAPSLVGVAASAVNSTTDPSANGRTVSAARWNAHYLIPRQNAGSTTIDSRPVTNFVSPDWVMVTKDGPKTLSAPDSSVIGRYAYAIYDEGGLLDANVAGFPSGLTNFPSAGTNAVSMKGSAAMADLAQIGITNADNLVGWRNYATARPAGSLGSYSFDTTSLQRYWTQLTNATNSGFVNASTNSFNSRTDQLFTSRQALLKFQRAAGFPQDALQYLGTFSRALEQASIRPDPNRPKNTGARLRTDTDVFVGWGGNDAYDSTGALQNQINPSFLATTRSDGTPVAKRRFPLSRLALFEKPVADTMADMKRYFGLVWDVSAERWNYTSPDGNTAPTHRIKTLSEVAAVGREPDFFEVIKAAVICDSLGKQNGGNEVLESPSRFTSGDAAVDGYIDLQIFQIGANIIDQADADGYPTAIRTADGPIGLGSVAEPPAKTISGAEDLPYLYGWMSAWYRTRQLDAADILPTHQPPGTKFPFETATLLQPIIWNPHAQSVGTPPAGLPTQFRVVAGGVRTGSVPLAVHPLVRSKASDAAAAAWWPGYDPDPLLPKLPQFPVNNVTAEPQSYLEAIVSPANSWITFETTVSGKASFREPQRLQSPNYPPGSNSASAAEGLISKISSGELADLSDPDTASAFAMGIYTGRCWTGPTNDDANPATTDVGSYLNMGSISKGLRLELQYRNASGNYVTYDTIDYAYCTSSVSSVNNMSIVDNNDAVSFNRGMRTGVRADPRTNRWGLPTMRVSPTWDLRVPFPTAVNSFPLDPVFGMSIYRWPQGQTLGPDGTTASGPFYRAIGDNQGGVPKASGWRPGGGTQGRVAYSDLAANLRTVPGGGSSDATAIPGGKTYYTDPDGVLRRAAGAFFTTGSRAGLPLNTGNVDSRPVILNRPFRSVAELGYAFRGVAWKDLDFFTPESGDAALLDAFCLNEIDVEESVVAGRVNLNTRQPRVLAALINGVSKAEGGMLNATESLSAANTLVTWTADAATQIGGVAARGPLRNRSELVGKFVSTNGAVIPTGGSGPNRADVPNIDGSVAFSGYSSALTNGVFATASDVSIKRRHESVIRALADAGDTRTWNLLIDLVAQTGRYGNSGTTDLAKFIVEGETRYWLHIAIDRFTGEVVGKQIEVVGD
jgi:hypothetical protein